MAFAEVTAAQVRRVVEDLIDMGRWKTGDRDILTVFDSPRMAHVLKGLPSGILGRTCVDRVMPHAGPDAERDDQVGFPLRKLPTRQSVSPRLDPFAGVPGAS